MNNLTITTLLESTFDKSIADKLVSYYQDVVDKYFQCNWAECIVASGKFSESMRRALDLKLFGAYTEFNKGLSHFDANQLSKYENQKNAHKSFRILIPRAIKVISDIRNERGGVHASNTPSDEIDAILVLYSVKWVLAEVVKIKSNLPPNETKILIETIAKRLIPLIWDNGDITKVMDKRVGVKDKILLLLNHLNEPKTRSQLYKKVEYSNKTYFNKYIKELHKSLLIHHCTDSDLCTISPKGKAKAEEIMIKRSKLPN